MGKIIQKVWKQITTKEIYENHASTSLVDKSYYKWVEEGVTTFPPQIQHKTGIGNLLELHSQCM